MKICEITGKVAQVGNNVAHSNKKTKRRFNPNLKTLLERRGRTMDYAQGQRSRHQNH